MVPEVIRFSWEEYEEFREHQRTRWSHWDGETFSLDANGDLFSFCSNWWQYRTEVSSVPGDLEPRGLRHPPRTWRPKTRRMAGDST